MHTEAQCHASDISNQFDNRADAIAHVNEYAEARDLIAAERGKHFDPDVADAFLAGFDAFVAIAQAYQEGDAPRE